MWNKRNQESLKKLQLKLIYECEDLERSQSRANALSDDPDNQDLLAIWTRKVEIQNEIIKRLQEQIDDIKGLSREENQETLDILEMVNILIEKIKGKKTEIARKVKIVRQLQTPSCRPITLNPSSIFSQVDADDVVPPQQRLEDLPLVGYIKPCALCTKAFPNKDVILAPCGCNYHPWCCVTQNWLSKTCAADTCRLPFTKAWKRSMGVFNKNGK